MNILDICIIGIVFLLTYIGYTRGALKLLGAGLSLLLGICIGSRVSLVLISHSQNNLIRLATITIITTGISFGLLLLGLNLGARLRTKILVTKFYKPDSYIGIGVGLVMALALCWFSGSLVMSNSSASIENTILSSKIIRFIDRQTMFGKSVYDVFYAIDPDHNLNIGQITGGPAGPGPYSISVSEPFTGTFAKALSKDYPGVVHIIRPGCYLAGSYGDGSGYIAAKDIVVTAAHVVAGAGLVTVQDTQDNTYIGDVIKYDVNHDLAIIDVPGLAGHPLVLDSSVQQFGEKVAILGFPGTNHFQSNNGILQVYGNYSGLGVDAPALNAGKGAMFYQTNAAAFPGDSGGPLITSTGAVIGHFTVYHASNPSYVASDDNPGDIANTDSVALHDYYNELVSSEKNIQRVSTGYCPYD